MAKPLILVVDDEIGIRRIVQVNLERAGYAVFTAQDGFDALEKLKQSEEKPSLILADVTMPYMDGFELLSNLKADDNYKAIPVVMVTARSRDADMIEGKERGAEQYITKPIIVPELMDVVRHILGDPAEE